MNSKNDIGFTATDYNRARPQRAATRSPSRLDGPVVFVAGLLAGSTAALVATLIAAMVTR